MTFENKLDEALYVSDWHLHSDKTTDVKHSTMTIEQAESIIAEAKKDNRVD